MYIEKGGVVIIETNKEKEEKITQMRSEDAIAKKDGDYLLNMENILCYLMTYLYSKWYKIDLIGVRKSPWADDVPLGVGRI